LVLRESEKGRNRKMEKKLHDEKLHNLYSSPYIIRVVITSGRTMWPEHAAHMREMRTAHKILVRKREGKRPFRIGVG
jgi:hypothetical protein